MFKKIREVIVGWLLEIVVPSVGLIIMVPIILFAAVVFSFTENVRVAEIAMQVFGSAWIILVVTGVVWKLWMQWKEDAPIREGAKRFWEAKRRLDARLEEYGYVDRS